MRTDTFADFKCADAIRARIITKLFMFDLVLSENSRIRAENKKKVKECANLKCAKLKCASLKCANYNTLKVMRKAGSFHAYYAVNRLLLYLFTYYLGNAGTT